MSMKRSKGEPPKIAPTTFDGWANLIQSHGERCSKCGWLMCECCSDCGGPTEYAIGHGPGPTCRCYDDVCGLCGIRENEDGECDCCPVCRRPREWADDDGPLCTCNAE
jgi:hypothetical protein